VPPVKVSAVVDRPAAEVFAYVTDPGRFHEWQQGVIDGHLETSADAADGGRGVPRVGAKCLTTRRIGGADRTVTSVLTHVDPPRSWGVRGIDGPVRASVDVTVEPVTESSARVSIAVDFTGHGIGRVLVPLIVRPRRARRCRRTSPR
jgi:uncharacterized protein YndB with AHSA1/START domain